MSYNEFSQFLHDYHSRYSKYAFKAYNKEGTGVITTDEFCDLLTSVKVIVCPLTGLYFFLRAIC